LLLALILTAALWAGQTDSKQEKIAVQHCNSAEKAIVYYRAKVWKYQDALGDWRNPTNHPERKRNACAYKLYVAHNWQGIARVYRKEYEYHYAWWKWLPDKWQRIGACETGYGKRPGRWNWNSGSYQGAFGFASSTWDQYKPRGAPTEAYQATPRQQYQAALNVVAAVGLSGWGCRNA
jgi:Transglycosylase-like domain